MRAMRRAFLMATTGAITFIGGCLPDNFWGDKMGEIVNTTIMEIWNTLVLDQIVDAIPI